MCRRGDPSESVPADFCLSEFGFAQFFAKQYDDAIKTFGKMLAPGLHVRGCIAACYAHLDRDEEVRVAADACREQAEVVYFVFTQKSRDGMTDSGIPKPVDFLVKLPPYQVVTAESYESAPFS